MLRLTLALFLFLFSSQAYSEDNVPLRIGISGFALASQRDQIVDATSQALTPLFKKQGIKVTHYSVLELEDAVKKGEVDIILSSSGFARRMSPYGVRPIATVISPGLEEPNQNEGSLFIVAQKSSISSISDMKGKILSANLPWGFSGYLIAKGEIAFQGFDTDSFFSNENFVGKSDGMLKITQNVANGNADVGILRLCAFEALAKTHPQLISKVKPIVVKKQSASVCISSTQLYPAHTLSVTPRVSSQLARQMTIQLLEMKPTKSGRSWSIASDYHHVDKLLETLKIGPYRYLREWTLRTLINYAWPWLMLSCFALLGWGWHTRRTEMLLKKRGELLKRMFAIEARQAEELAHLQRTSTVNQLSSIVAHELRQPLAALTFYAGGLEMMLEKGKTDENKIRRFSAGITKEAKRASDIVDSVRAYAKNKHQERIVLNLKEIINEAISLSIVGKDLNVKVETHLLANQLIKGNKLEITLVIVNLIKNAIEATKDQPNPKIRITQSDISPRHLLLSIEDNGTPLSENEITKLGNPTASSKPDGLGLGLSIAKTICEAHGGNLSFNQSMNDEYPGLLAQLKLPKL